MIGPDNTVTTTLLSDKLSLFTHHHRLTRVLVKLDLEDWNFGSCEFFFEQLCSSYDVTKFLHDDPNVTTSSTASPFTPDEIKVDKIILSWIFTTISDSLQKRLVVARPTFAKAAWKILTDIVKDNKWSRTSALKTELRSIQLGTLSMEAYFQKIESLVTILTSLDCVVNDEDVTARSLLIAEEMRLKSKELASPVDSSSPMVLMAQSGTNLRPSNPQVKSWRPCFNFAKGSCRFGSECRYVHDPNAKPHDLGNSKHSNTSNTDALLVKLLEKLGLNNKGDSQNCSTVASPIATPSVPVAYATNHNPAPMYYLPQPVSRHTAPPGFSTLSGPVLIQPAQHSVPSPGFRLLPAQYAIPQHTTPQPLAQQPSSSVIQPMGPAQQPSSGPTASLVNVGQATLLPQAFTAKTLHDPTTGAWNMDTVTTLSPIPHAFLVSQHMWHQRLGHPESEVLRRLVSNNVISCNKEKPRVLCHACQLGKHVRLPFVSSSTIVTSCFEIIHSDVWTSPIPSLYGFKYYVLFLDHYS
ncbi:ribonuclease H-like domain-containing protein [Tanacetum coccineum]